MLYILFLSSSTIGNIREVYVIVWKHYQNCSLLYCLQRLGLGLDLGLGFVWVGFVHFFLVIACLVVSVGAVVCPERLDSKMSYYVSQGTLNCAQSLTYFRLCFIYFPFY